MVATRHCCWGKCNNDSRYPERLPDSLKEMLKNGQKAFIPFPKPRHDLKLCQRWVNACSRQNFSVKNVNYNTYICAVHWPGGKGPTKEFPDPFKANLWYPVISFHGQIVPSQIVPINCQIVPQNSQIVPQNSQFVPHMIYLFSK